MTPQEFRLIEQLVAAVKAIPKAGGGKNMATNLIGRMATIKEKSNERGSCLLPASFEGMNGVMVEIVGLHFGSKADDGLTILLRFPSGVVKSLPELVMEYLAVGPERI